LVLAMPAAAGAAPTPPLGQHGGWITDARGRVVILHGVNMVYKRPPYDPALTGFGNDDAAFLARHGFNNVRLGTIYAGVEPRPGEYDDAYIARIGRVERMLARHGVFSLIDFHQDLYNERFGGEGFPDWAVLDDGLPAQPTVGFPLTYVTSPGLNRVFESLWSNRAGPGGVGLQDRYAAAWGHVARHFAGRPFVMGYDLINEPWQGQHLIARCGVGGCPDFERGPLATLQAKAMRAIRRHDTGSLIWYEPVILSQFGAAQYTMPNPTGDRRAGMSFHIYCLQGAAPGANTTCGQFEQMSLDNARARGRANGDPLLLSEFGATDNLDVIHRMVDRADRAMVSWQWWHYCGCADPTTSGPGDAQAVVADPAKPPEGANVFAAKLAALVRPYPQAVAGTPRSYFFDRSTRTFTLSYSTARAGGAERFAAGSTTDVFVPGLHYPNGYSVTVHGARVASPARSRVLKLRSLPGADDVHVHIRPGPGAFPRVTPPRFTARATPRRDRRRPYRVTVTGALRLPEGVDRADGCHGRVTVTAVRRGRRATRKRTNLRQDCGFRIVLTLPGARGRHVVAARFDGNRLLLPVRAGRRAVRAG
jgi:endoglycosylceramidase